MTMTKVRARSLAVVLVLGLVLGLGPAGGGVHAAPPVDLRAQVERLLSGYEPMPANVQAGLLRLGPRCAEVLLAMARDQRLAPIKRLRAIEALGYVPTAEGLGYLRQIALTRRDATDPVPVYELQAAVSALAGFGPAALADLSPFLSHQSVDVREAAVRSLGQVRTAESERLLSGRMAVEREPSVRSLLQQVLILRSLAR